MPAIWGDSSTGELCFRTAGIRVQLPVVPLRHGAEALIGERLDGIEKVAGAIPVSSTASNAGEDYITIMVLR